MLVVIPVRGSVRIAMEGARYAWNFASYPRVYKVILLPVSYIPFASTVFSNMGMGMPDGAEIFPLRQIFVFLLASKIIAGGVILSFLGYNIYPE